MVSKSRNLRKTLVTRRKMKQKNFTIGLLSVLLTTFVICTIVLYSDNKMIKTSIGNSGIAMEDLASAIDNAAQIQKTAMSVRSDNAILAYQNQTMVEAVFDMEEQQQELANELEIANTKLKEFEEAEQLYTEYGYSLTYRGRRTDLTLDQLKTASEVCKENDVPMDLLLGVVLTESGGKEDAKNSTSTATGYGQLLYGTAKVTYEKDMQAGPYSEEYALDGEMNLTMTATYLGKLLNVKNSTEEALYSYRGLRSPEYVAHVMSVKE